MTKPYDTVGQPPALAGRRCMAALCESYACAGEHMSVVALNLLVEDLWHRLFIDSAVIFWRRGTDRPEPYEMPEIGAAVTIVDIGQIAGVVGDVIMGYDTTHDDGELAVTVRFAGGHDLTLTWHEDDRCSCSFV